jgi:histidyl-tRNA synthetase
VLDGVMEAIGLGGPENAARRLIVLRAIDKLDRLGPEGVRALLGAGRKDESGDFTKGAGLAESAATKVLAFTAARGMTDALTLDNLEKVVAESALGLEGVAELRLIGELVEAAGYGVTRVVIDPAVVRGLEYYTGPVFEAELTFEVKDETGRPIRFGSVGGGGRYDGLVSRFLNEPVPATGFSIGVSRLLSALKAVKSPIVAGAASAGPVIVLAMDRTPEALAGYQAMVADLRRAGIRAEMYLGDGKMKPQMKYADRRASVCVVIQGSNEREAGEALVKDLVLGADLSAIADRNEYLRKQAEVQFTVKTAEIVAGVQKVLARHGL